MERPSQEDTPLSNIQAEQAFLSAALYRVDLIEDNMDTLAPEDFTHGVHGALWAEMQARARAGARIINPVTLKDWANANIPGWGVNYLVDLAASVVMTTSHIVSGYAQVVRDLSHRRALVDEARRLTQEAHDTTHGPLGANEVQDRHEARLLVLADQGPHAQTLVTLKDGARSVLDRYQACLKDGVSPGLSFGMPVLDGFLGGIQPDELLILGARPGMGKSAFAAALGVRVARQNLPVVIFSMEMKAQTIVERIMAAETGLPLRHLSHPTGPRDRSDTLAAFVNDVKLPLFIEDRGTHTVASIRSVARRLKRRHGLGFIIIDYLQLISTPRSERRDSKVTEVTDISRALKALAMDLNVPVLALSQLSRETERRPGKRPLLSDLRESGSIEQDADKVIFLYRESYYASQTPDFMPDPDPDTTMEVIVAKNRRGRLGTVQVIYDPQTQRIDAPSGRTRPHV